MTKMRPILLLGLLLASLEGLAVELAVVPPEASPGGDVLVLADGLPPGTSFSLRVRETTGGTTVDLGTRSADQNGRFEEDLEVGMLTPGEYAVELLDRALRPFASAALSVLPAPVIALDRTEAYPGDRIRASLSGLRPGAARIVVDDRVVAGPVSVDDPSLEVEFQLPEGLAGGTEVVLENLRSRGVAGRASTTLTRLERGAGPVTLLAFERSDTPANPRVPFSVSGSVAVPAGTDPTELEWTYALRRGDGSLIPFQYSGFQMAASGDFQIAEVRYPGLTTGTRPVIPGPTDSEGLVYVNPDTGESGFVETGDEGDPPPGHRDVDLSIRVVDTTGAPIEGAVVVLSLLGPAPIGPAANLTKGAGQTFSPVNPGYVGVFPVNQVSIFRNEAELECPDYFNIELTDANGEVSMRVDQLMSMAVDYASSKVAVPIAGFTSNPTQAPTEPAPAFSIRINALGQGYGYRNADGDGAPVRFDVAGNFGGEFYLRDPETGAFVVPVDPENTTLTVALPPYDGPVRFTELPYVRQLPPPQSEPVPILPANPSLLNKGTAGATAQALLTVEAPVLSQVYGFPGLAGTAGFQVIEPLIVRQRFNQALYGELSNPTLTITNVGSFAMRNDFDTSQLCQGDLQELSARVTSAPFLPAGLYEARITGELESGQRMENSFRLRVAEGPDWFADDTVFEDLQLLWFPDRVDIRADEIPKVINADAGTDEFEELEEYEIGDLDNDNATGGFVTHRLNAAGYESKIRFGFSSSQVGGNGGNPETVVEDITHEETGGSTKRCIAGLPCEHPGAKLIEFGSKELETIVDTGKIPLFRYAWGVPPIAAATLGADIWFLLQYYYYGTIDLVDGLPLVDFEASPLVSAGLDIFFDLSALFGIVSARVEAGPQIDVAMLIEVIANQIQPPKPCFKFALDLRYQVSVGKCDFCVEKSDDVELFSILEPGGCKIPESKIDWFGSKGVRPEPRPTRGYVSSTDAASNGSGETLTAWDTPAGIEVRIAQGEVTVHEEQLPSMPGAMQPSVAYLDGTRAVVAWAQTPLDPQQFEKLSDLNAGLAAMHLVYTLWDGTAFGPVQSLTPPGAASGVGGVELVACPDGEVGCPAGGELLALWHRARDADLGQQAIAIDFAFFDGLAWGPVETVDAASTAKQVQPTATFLLGEPVALWVENPAATATAMNLNQRFLRYRFLRIAGPQDALGLPSAVASPSLAATPDGRLLATYSVSTEPERFVGSRRALHTAEATNCVAGVCDWTDGEQTDLDGRTIFVERPQLLRTGGNSVQTVFRYLGNSEVRSDDPVGVRTRRGDTARMPFQGVGVPSPLVPISNDGAVNWRATAVYDAATNAMAVVAVKEPGLTDVLLGKALGVKTTKLPSVRSKTLDDTSGITVSLQSQAPDLAIVSVEGVPASLAPGGSFDLTVEVINLGGESSAQVPLTATFGGPDGVGISAAATSIPVPAPGARQESILAVAVPADFFADDARPLFVEVNAAGDLLEADGSNNAFEQVIGALPVPEDLEVLVSEQSSVVQLNWSAAEDDRVAGYLVFREDAAGNETLLGESPVAGYADLLSENGQSYRYRVRSYSSRLIQSPPSEWIETFVPALNLPPLSDEVFADGFEAPAFP